MKLGHEVRAPLSQPLDVGLMVSCRTEAEQSFEHVRVPSDGDHGSWRTFCFGDEAADEPQRQPTMPVLMAIDQVHIATVRTLPLCFCTA